MARRRSEKLGLYTALVEGRLASMVSGALLPTRAPFLYTLSFTALEGVDPGDLEAAAHRALESVRPGGIEPAELIRAQRQLRARLVFENDSVTNIAHQLGYFETVVGPEFVSTLQRRIDAVTLEQVWDVARAASTRRRRRLVSSGLSPGTVGLIQPPPRSER